MKNGRFKFLIDTILIMRVLEIILLTSLILLAVSYFLPTHIKGKEKLKITLLINLAAVIIFSIHLILEHAIWQMVPIYILIFVFLVVNLIEYKKSQKQEVEQPSIKKKIYYLKGMVIILLVAISGIIPLLVPVFNLPEPTGTYAIGTTSFVLSNPNQKETFTEDPLDVRVISVKAWYPADSAAVVGKTPISYVNYSSELGRGFEIALGVPGFIAGHISEISTHSYLNVPLSDEKDSYPVVIFSHGYGGFDAQNTALMEELASHGYCIFSIGHPYDASYVSLLNGSGITFQHSISPESIDESNEIVLNQGTIISSSESTLTEKIEALQIINSSSQWETMATNLEIWTNDTIFLLDQLEILNNTGINGIFNGFIGKLNLNYIGLFGHSFGGATSGEVCLLDDRIQAGINMDGLEMGHILDLNLTKPFMFMYSEENAYMNDIPYLLSENTSYTLVINDTRHFDYCDFTIFSSVLELLGMIGSINGYRMLDITNAYVLAFFDKYLKGETINLLDGNSEDYPEVLIKNNGL